MTQRRLHAFASIVLLCVAAPAAAQPANAQITERQRQETLKLLTDARTLVLDAKLREAIDPLSKVVEQARSATSDRDMRLTLVRAYAYRAHAFLVLGEEPRAREDLTALVRVDAGFVLDDETSAPLHLIHDNIKKANVGTIVFELPPTASAEVDGFSLPTGTTQYPIFQGSHRVVLTAPGRPPQVREVVVRVGSSQTVRLAAQTAPATTAAAVQPDPPAQPPIRNSGPRFRRGLIHSSAPMVLYTSSSSPSSRFTQVIYNRVGTFTPTQSPTIKFGGFEFGGAFALRRTFALGLTYSKSDRLYGGVLNGTLPSPTTAVLRPVTDVDADTRDVARAYHVEVRGQFGGDHHETVVFFGPTFLELDRDYIRRVTVTEGAAGAFTVTPVHTKQSERQIGLNMGLDVGWFPVRFVGVGFGTRYVWSRYQGVLGGVTVPANHAILATIGVRARF